MSKVEDPVTSWEVAARRTCPRSRRWHCLIDRKQPSIEQPDQYGGGAVVHRTFQAVTDFASRTRTPCRAEICWRLMPATGPSSRQQPDQMFSQVYGGLEHRRIS
jgi:hypothetical protein